MNDNYDFSDYRAVMPYTGDAGIYRDDETARLEERDQFFSTYGRCYGEESPPPRRLRPA